MKYRPTISMLGVLLLSACVVTWAQGVQSDASHLKFRSGKKISAELKTELSSERSKVGDLVTAVTTEAAIGKKGTLPAGTTLTGHVTTVTPASGGAAPASLGVLFDRATLPDGSELNLRAEVASFGKAARPQEAAMAPEPGSRYGGASSSPSSNASANNNSSTENPAGNPPSNAISKAADATANATKSAAGATADATKSAAGAAAGIATVPESTTSGPMRASNGAEVRITMPPSGSAEAMNGSTLSTKQGDLRINAGTNLVLEVVR